VLPPDDEPLLPDDGAELRGLPVRGRDDPDDGGGVGELEPATAMKRWAV
jgi:hypothetical protein